MNCKFCLKQCKNDNSLRNHQRLCRYNPDRQTSSLMKWNTTGRLQWTRSGTPGRNQYTKAKELGLPIPAVSDETKRKISDSVRGRSKEWNEKNGNRISETINKKVSEGTWHTSLAKHMHIDYNGIDMHGSWEVEYAKYLDENGIKWIRNKDSFTYTFNGKERKYTPDFYLIDSDEYIEIKGYKTEKDDAKWSQFPKHRKLTVLMESELKLMNII